MYDIHNSISHSRAPVIYPTVRSSLRVNRAPHQQNSIDTLGWSKIILHWKVCHQSINTTDSSVQKKTRVVQWRCLRTPAGLSSVLITKDTSQAVVIQMKISECLTNISLHVGKKQVCSKRTFSQNYDKGVNHKLNLVFTINNAFLITITAAVALAHQCVS